MFGVCAPSRCDVFAAVLPAESALKATSDIVCVQVPDAGKTLTFMFIHAIDN